MNYSVSIPTFGTPYALTVCAILNAAAAFPYLLTVAGIEV